MHQVLLRQTGHATSTTVVAAQVMVLVSRVVTVLGYWQTVAVRLVIKAVVLVVLVVLVPAAL